ncbi:MAG: ADOP family duplicated permease [Gemmatimonadota bacterium]
MTTPRPPRLAEALLGLILSPHDRAHALGDLHEEYGSLHRAAGRGAANRWYWSQVLRALGPSLGRRLRSPVSTLSRLAEQSRLAFRALRRRPGLVVTGVTTLALGIGAATAIFSVADAVLLRPLPYPEGDRLVTIWDTYDDWRGHEVLSGYWDRIPLSWPELIDLRERQTSFEEIAAYGTASAALTGAGDPEEVLVGYASATLFPLLGAPLHLGRTFSADEVGQGAPRLAVLSYELWRDRYGEDPDLAGTRVVLDDRSFRVIGVLRPGFLLSPLGPFAPGIGRHALWLPIGADGSPLERGNHAYETLGHLAPGVTLERAGTEAASILWADRDPDTRGVRVTLRRDEEIGDTARPLLLLLAAVGLLLVIACGSVASLLLGDAVGRRRELATKSALGAGTGLLVRQLALETAFLGLAGAALGVLLAHWGVGVLLTLAPPGLPLPPAIPLDLRILGFAAALGLGAGLAVGILPALTASRRDLRRDLYPRFGEGEGGRRSQRALIALQIAVSLVLLVSSALLARSFGHLHEVELGFDPGDLVTARVALPEARYGSPQEAALFFHSVAERLHDLPGVEGATAISAVPFSGRGGSSSFDLVDRDPPLGAPDPEALRRTILPDYHSVMRIPLVEGRYLEPSDRTEDAPVVVVSESMARRYWPDGSAVGSRIERDRREWEIVGIVADVLHADPSADALPTFYVPLDVAEARSTMTLVVRSGLPAGNVADQIRTTVWEVDPGLPVEDVATADALVARSTTEERFRTLLVTAFALIATLMCAVGLFGVVARGVSARTSELGIRVALGAGTSTLLGHVLAREIPPLVAGVVLGVAGSFAAGTLLAGFLFEVGPRDPASLGLGVAVLTGAALVAILAAARRALGLDPLRAIRAE